MLLELTSQILGVQRFDEVEAEAEGHEDAWDDDVAQAENAVLGLFGAVVLREHKLDWRIDSLGHREHHVGAKHEEDIVEEQQNEQSEAVFEVANEHGLQSVDTEY